MNHESLPIDNPAYAEASLGLKDEILGSEHAQTIVMLHGWGRSLESLRGLGELLAVNFKVVLLDLPGFGGSPLHPGASNDGGGWDTLDYAKCVKAYLDRTGIEHAILLGHSFGGRISIRLSSRYPERFSSLILIGSHGLQLKRSLRFKLRSYVIRNIGRLTKWLDGATGTRLYERMFIPRYGSVDYKNAGALRKTLVKTVTENLSKEVQAITLRTLLLWGEQDEQTPLELARQFHRLIPKSELHVFPNAGHEPFMDVGANLMCRYIERFLAEEDPTK